MFFEVRQRLLAIGEYYINNPRRVVASDFTNIIRRQFDSKDYVFCTRRDPVVDPDMVLVSGAYDSYNDQDDLPSIEITLNYNPEQIYYFTNVVDWERFSFDLSECVCHELVHQQQHRAQQRQRGYRSRHTDVLLKEEQEYLGSSEEIEAYGFSIAAESVTFDKPYTECTMYQVYQSTFFEDHSVVTKLEKHIRKYLKNMEFDNGYQNNSTARTRV